MTKAKIRRLGRTARQASILTRFFAYMMILVCAVMGVLNVPPELSEAWIAGSITPAGRSPAPSVAGSGPTVLVIHT